MKNIPLIVIVGETASGKSKLAFVLAEKFGGEIISADSMNVYKNFDIGTAKPSKQDRVKIKHHLIDVANPEEGFNVAKYMTLAKASISEIHGRNKIPIMVGGSGLYIDSVLFDFGLKTVASSSQRAELNLMDNKLLLARAKTLGISTDGIDISNSRRLVRLIESKGQKPTKKPIRPDTIIIGTLIDRDKLNKNIADRVDDMLLSGLQQEVQVLSGIYGWNIEAMQGIGYREFEKYFDGQATISEVRESIIQDTKRLAKKQRTWFKRNNSIHWVAEQVEAVDLVTTFLNNYRR